MATFWTTFGKKLGYFLFQHLVTLPGGSNRAKYVGNTSVPMAIVPILLLWVCAGIGMDKGKRQKWNCSK